MLRRVARAGSLAFDSGVRAIAPIIVLVLARSLVPAGGHEQSKGTPQKLEILGAIVDDHGEPIARVRVGVLARATVIPAGKAKLDESKIVDDGWKPIGMGVGDEEGRFRVRVQSSTKPDDTTRHITIGGVKRTEIAGRPTKWERLVVATFEDDGSKGSIDLGQIKLDKRAIEWIAE